MMRTTTRKLFLLLLLCFYVAAVFSRDDDFGIWYGVSAEHKIIKNLEINLTGNVRTFKNASKVDEMFLEAGLTYKFNRYLSAGASYRFGEYFEDDDSFHPRHKWFIDLKGTLPAGDLTITARFRFQERYRTYFEDEEDKLPASHGRAKLKTLYNIPSFPVNPYVAAELFFPVFTGTTRYIDKSRFMAGLEYNFAKKHSVELEYMFQRDFLPHIKDINVITVGYNLKF